MTSPAPGVTAPDGAADSDDPRIVRVHAGWQASCCGMIASVPSHARDCRYREQEQAC